MLISAVMVLPPFEKPIKYVLEAGTAAPLEISPPLTALAKPI